MEVVKNVRMPQIGYVLTKPIEDGTITKYDRYKGRIIMQMEDAMEDQGGVRQFTGMYMHIQYW